VHIPENSWRWFKSIFMENNNSRLIHDVREIILRDLDSLHEEMASVPDHLLWKVVPGVFNSAGTLSHHICGNLRHFIGAKLAHDDYVRNREDEFGNRTMTKTQLLDEIRFTIGAVDTALANFNAERLNDPMPDPPEQHKGRTIAFFLVQLCCHLSRHRGQLNYIRRILEAGSYE